MYSLLLLLLLLAICATHAQEEAGSIPAKKAIERVQLVDPTCDPSPTRVPRMFCELNYQGTWLALDSVEYDLLAEAVALVDREIPGASVEIGLRSGGSSALIMDTFLENSNPRAHIAMDPYGDIPYLAAEGREVTLDYSNRMRDMTLSGLYRHAYQQQHNFVFLQLEDTEFMKRFHDGVPLYDAGGKKLQNFYCFVFFDGPHAYDAIQTEVDFFNTRSPHGAVWVFDDIGDYDHESLHYHILSLGWEVIRIGKVKASYVKKTKGTWEL